MRELLDLTLALFGATRLSAMPQSESYNSSEFLYGLIYVRHAVKFDKAVAANVKSTLAAIADEVVK